jgi:hypothetical protein
MIDPHSRASFGEPGGHPGQSEHLDELAAMLLADGEAQPQAERHVAGCAACAARVAAFRAEAGALATSFALDLEEATFVETLLPRRAALWVPAPPRRAGAGNLAPATLLASTLILAAAIGWQAATGLLVAAYDAASRAGATALVADTVMGWAIEGARAGWAALDALSDAPLIASPAVPLLALAALLWAALVLMPRSAQRPASA